MERAEQFCELALSILNVLYPVSVGIPPLGSPAVAVMVRYYHLTNRRQLALYACEELLRHVPTVDCVDMPRVEARIFMGQHLREQGDEARGLAMLQHAKADLVRTEAHESTRLMRTVNEYLNGAPLDGVPPTAPPS